MNNDPAARNKLEVFLLYPSGATVTIFLFLYSFDSSIAAKIFAPADIPTNKPSICPNCLTISNASSSDIVIISS